MTNKKENGNTVEATDQVANTMSNKDIVEQERISIADNLVGSMILLLSSGRLKKTNKLYQLAVDVYKITGPKGILVTYFKPSDIPELIELSKSPDTFLYNQMHWNDEQVLIDRYLDRLNGQRISKELKGKGLKKHSSINLLTGIETQIE